ncbi:tungsten cofactor oxidoreductase radical SAM maturase [Candidatus Poribacteria bacterium]
MAKIVVGKDGKLSIPDEYVAKYGVKDGAEVHIWPSEDGLVIQYPRADVRRVYIEVTSLCNLNCITCVRNVWSDEMGHMDMETFHAIVRQLEDFPDVQSVTLAGFGEPLYHPEILNMARAIKDLGLELNISTNGTLLDADVAEELVDIGLDKIVVSLDSGHPQLFEDIRIGADLDIVLSNLRTLNEIKQRRSSKLPTIGIEFVAMRRNVHEIGDLPRLASLLGAVSIIVTNLLPHTEEMKEEVLYNDSVELPGCGGWPVRAGNSWVQWGTMSYPRMHWGSDSHCRFIGDRSLVIGWDGGISPCYALLHSYQCYIFDKLKHVSKYSIGNVCDRKLLELWTSEEYVRFRHKVRAFEFPSCMDCGMGCGYTDVNQDCWGADPSCADCLYARDIVRCP